MKTRIIAILALIALAVYWLNREPDTVPQTADIPQQDPESRPFKPTGTGSTSPLQEQHAEQAPIEQPVDLFAEGELGREAYFNSQRLYFQNELQELLYAPVIQDFVDRGDWSNLYLAGLSQLDTAAGHITLEIVDRGCRDYRKQTEEKRQKDRDNIDAQIDANTPSEKDMAFYQGFLAAREEDLRVKHQDCLLVANYKKENKEAIKSAALQVFNAKDISDYSEQFASETVFVRSLLEMSGIHPSQYFELEVTAKPMLEGADKDAQRQAAEMIFEATQDDPKVYLFNHLCLRFEDRCREAMGEGAYDKYLEDGAYLGNKSTFTSYLARIEKKGQQETILAWKIYRKQLNRFGCESKRLLAADMRWARELKASLAKLNEQQLQRVKQEAAALINEHLDNAREIIGC